MKNKFKWYRHKDGDIAFLIGVDVDGDYAFQFNSSGAVQYFANLDEFTLLPECDGFNWEPEPKIEFGSIWKSKHTGVKAVVAPGTGANREGKIGFLFTDGSGRTASSEIAYTKEEFLKHFEPA